MSQSAKSTAKRKHVTTACVSCRRSKVKCDGLVPKCTNCINKNNDCRYQMGDDRRKLSLRVAVELLCRRVGQLCQSMEENGLQIPEMQRDEAEVLQRVLPVVGITLDNLTASRHVSSSTNKTNDDITRSTQPGDYGEIANQGDGSIGLDSDFHRVSQSNNDVQTVPDLTQATQASTLMPDLSNQSWDSVSAPELPYGASFRSQAIPGTQKEHSDSSAIPGPLAQRMLMDSSTSPDDDISDRESVEELVDILSDRVGSLQIGAEGQIRYYGPTSDFSLLNMSSTDPLHVHRSIRNDGQDYLDRLDVGAEVPAELEEHLVNLYFAWQDASFHIVDRDMYEMSKLKWHQDMQDTPYYSEALRNAICSLGAAFETKHHPSFVTFPKSLADFFADRAKTLLDIEMDAPCVATVQAMVITSCHDMGCTRDARAWLYSGMASRVSFDLALHKDMTAYVAKGVMTQAEAELRRTVFWGAYVVDQTWAFHLGRHINISMEDVTCARPSGDMDVSVSSPWTPYSSVDASQTQLPVIGYVNEVSRQRVLLCEIMAPLGYNLYSSSSIAPATLQQLNAKTVVDLLVWKRDLPEPLQVDLYDKTTPYFPHVLLMHMHYYQSMIHAHRPWMSKTYIQPNPPQGPGSAHARMACVDAAISIAKLLEAYESRYTFRRINTQGPATTCSAALILIFADVSQYGRSQGLNTTSYLSTCFRALEEFGQSWESAKRARDFLIKLQRKWELKARARRSIRRNSELTKTLSNTSKKRPLAATDFELNQPTLKTTWSQEHRQQQSVEQQQQQQLRQTQQQHPYQPQQSHQEQQRQGNENDISQDFDMDFDWILEGNDQPASGKWTGSSSRSLPFDLIGFLGDSYNS